jgi:integrase
MSSKQPTATGFVRVVTRSTGPTFYAQLRLPDGSRPQRKLGPAWLKRSRPPAGHLTRAEAERRLAAILAGEDAIIGPIQRTGVTFAQAAAEWLRYVEHDRKRERSTIDGYRKIVRQRLVPEFGHLLLDEIDVHRAERWRMKLVEESLSANTINKVRWSAEAIYKRAMRLWTVPLNPFAVIERQPFRYSGDFTVYEPADVLALARRAITEQDGALFTVAAFTGLRLGELRALRWGDLDFGARLVHVRRSHVRGETKLPKSGRVRSVPMIDPVVAALDRLSRRPLFTDDDDLVFVNDVGETVEESALRRRFYKALAAAGLKRGRLHDLRHSYCSLAVRAYRLDEVKAYAGHADIAMTMRYVHHVPAHDAADRLSAVVAAATVHPTVHRTGDFDRNSGDLRAPESPGFTGGRLAAARS